MRTELPQPSVPAREVRKVVTVLFCDLAGYLVGYVERARALLTDLEVAA